MSIERSPTPSNAMATGFSLLELLVSVAIFAIMGTLLYTSLSQLSNLEVQARSHHQSRAGLLFAIRQLELDLLQAVPRPIRNESLTQEAAVLLDQQVLQFTRTASQPGFERGSQMRIRYRLSDQGLKRGIWLVLDRLDSEPHDEQTLLSEVETWMVRCMDSGGTWHNIWPTSHLNDAVLPRACEFSIATTEEEEVTHIVEMGY